MDRFTAALRSWAVVLRWPKDGWRGLSTRQQVGLVARGVAQTVVLIVAARDLRRRPREQVRGGKWLWAPVLAVNYLGIGPIAYLVGGRRRESHPAEHTRLAPSSDTRDEEGRR